MLHKTRGIVLKTTLYSENSVVVQIFTEKFGIQSYMINGVKKPRAKISMNMLQPLHLVDMVVYHKANTNIQRISELRPAPVFRNIPYDIIKSTIVIFLNEVLYKSIRQQTTDEQLFDFIFNAICWFDETEEQNVNFHLAFLLKLSRFLGFAPSTESKSDQNYFDLQEGEFRSAVPVHPYFLVKADALVFISLFSLPFEKINEINIENKTRRSILDKILVYYTLHTASFGEIRSHQVLEDVLS
ncbi:DNA repair protein RecO (recombination protein O) [Pedobacter africanus]|uniref:DNA repair protein RecO (Recombination protein O) n=1 Tax=Pedobacter africanus TaxID=151894 RepID=A0ACC6KYB5_9SPHI|nr:DNA repair protein RecO [Pedobacter africanus]MDR6784118.1 DNA repair protein RecO (recombination protein O) [Pedobacter africanus]